MPGAIGTGAAVRCVPATISGRPSGAFYQISWVRGSSDRIGGTTGVGNLPSWKNVRLRPQRLASCSVVSSRSRTLSIVSPATVRPPRS